MPLKNTTLTVTNGWKMAEIVPLFKSGDSTTNPANYRPISILLVRSKLLEKMIHLFIFISTVIIFGCPIGFQEGTLHIILYINIYGYSVQEHQSI